MSNSSITSTLGTPVPQTSHGPAEGRRRESGGAWKPAALLREPLLHFVILGGLIFAVDHAMLTRAGDPHVIVVGADVDRQARDVFKAARGREPNGRELVALRQVWLDNEVLYREGLALQVDRGDPTIRERVIFKALSIVDANVQLPPADDATLRAWFEKNLANYEEPARFDFEEAAPVGDRDEASVRAIVDALNSNAGGEAGANLRVFKGRPESNLVLSYGPEFAAALQAAEPSSEWHLLPGRDGPHAIRLVAHTPAKPADFGTLRGVVRGDWATATASEQRSAAVHALARKYKIVDAAPSAGDKIADPRAEDDDVIKPPATMTAPPKAAASGAPK